MLSSNKEFAAAKTTVVRPTSLQSFGDHSKPVGNLETDRGEVNDGLYSSFVGDRFQNHFQNTRNIFETGQPKQDVQQSPKLSVSGNSSPPVPSSPVAERVESFSALKKRFESDTNNYVQQRAPRATRHSCSDVGNKHRSWKSSWSPSTSRRSSASSMELNDRGRLSTDMSGLRKKIAIAKGELGEAIKRREVAERKYPEAKHRIQSSKQKSKSLRDQIRSLEEMIERKEKKIKDLTKRLGARTIVIEQNRRAADHCNKDIQIESELLEKMTQEIKATRAKKKTTVEQIRDIVQRISTVKAAIADAEKREDLARNKVRRLEDVLTKTSIRLKNARFLSANKGKRTSFKGFQLEDIHKKIAEQRERTRRAKSDISYLEYRKELVAEQLAECKEVTRRILIRLKPDRQQRALGFQYTRLPMSEEL